jgi:cell division protease FtsH
LPKFLPLTHIPWNIQRAAEKLVFNSITTGASNDIEKATELARAMVTQYGMSEKFGLMGLESVENRYLDGRTVLNCGEQTAAEIDQEVMKILKDCYARAEELLAGNRDVLDKIADYLIGKESITGDEFMKIYREIKGLPEEPMILRIGVLVFYQGSRKKANTGLRITKGEGYERVSILK